MKSGDMEILRQKSRLKQSSAAHILDDSSSSSEEVIRPRPNRVLHPSAIHSHVGYSYGMEPSFPTSRSYSGIPREPILERQSPRTEQFYQRMTRTPSEKAAPIVSGIGPPTGRRTCNCKRSNCLKLYCDCFASGEYCVNCNCSCCYNNIEHEAARAAAVRAILERNPNAFRPKIASSRPLPGSPAFQETELPLPGKHNKGCACKKSGCLKKYCECFNAGVVCSDNCKCTCCRNFEGSLERRAILENMERSLFESGPAYPITPSRPQHTPVPAFQSHSGKRQNAFVPVDPMPVAKVKVFDNGRAQEIVKADPDRWTFENALGITKKKSNLVPETEQIENLKTVTVPEELKNKKRMNIFPNMNPLMTALNDQNLKEVKDQSRSIIKRQKVVSHGQERDVLKFFVEALGRADDAWEQK